ncbi:hypothetical protein CONPUDRAFT_69134 [Coniophora puteana RWD-64-598 SS2]|uniref:Uncharacterized protein n=1 Tax=Coniophora puteana (strain RWD-64-598) TaxID=741705 RepID=A0A5M3N757_CONPW|nr:uncharacterized protein CONPUDRAFT_69134 [Coniophora puteana RWD-64-598 SS2]EIW86691.1 hypothetical protein CONPUDRAFT_69134 [Coniophora puteana RWD-64-598 SS2]
MQCTTKYKHSTDGSLAKHTAGLKRRLKKTGLKSIFAGAGAEFEGATILRMNLRTLETSGEDFVCVRYERGAFRPVEDIADLPCNARLLCSFPLDSVQDSAKRLGGALEARYILANRPWGDAIKGVRGGMAVEADVDRLRDQGPSKTTEAPAAGTDLLMQNPNQVPRARPHGTAVRGQAAGTRGGRGGATRGVRGGTGRGRGGVIPIVRSGAYDGESASVQPGQKRQREDKGSGLSSQSKKPKAEGSSGSSQGFKMPFKKPLPQDDASQRTLTGDEAMARVLASMPEHPPRPSASPSRTRMLSSSSSTTLVASVSVPETVDASIAIDPGLENLEHQMPKTMLPPPTHIRTATVPAPVEYAPLGMRGPPQVSSPALPSHGKSSMAPPRAPSAAPSRAPSKAPPGLSKAPPGASKAPPGPSKAPHAPPSRVPSMTPSRAPSMAPSRAPSMAPPGPLMVPSRTPVLIPHQLTDQISGHSAELHKLGDMVHRVKTEVTAGRETTSNLVERVTVLEVAVKKSVEVGTELTKRMDASEDTVRSLQEEVNFLKERCVGVDSDNEIMNGIRKCFIAKLGLTDSSALYSISPLPDGTFRDGDRIVPDFTKSYTENSEWHDEMLDHIEQNLWKYVVGGAQSLVGKTRAEYAKRLITSFRNWKGQYVNKHKEEDDNSDEEDVKQWYRNRDTRRRARRTQKQGKRSKGRRESETLIDDDFDVACCIQFQSEEESDTPVGVSRKAAKKTGVRHIIDSDDDEAAPTRDDCYKADGPLVVRRATFESDDIIQVKIKLSRLGKSTSNKGAAPQDRVRGPPRDVNLPNLGKGKKIPLWALCQTYLTERGIKSPDKRIDWTKEECPPYREDGDPVYEKETIGADGDEEDGDNWDMYQEYDGKQYQQAGEEYEQVGEQYQQMGEEYEQAGEECEQVGEQYQQMGEEYEEAVEECEEAVEEGEEAVEEGEEAVEECEEAVEEGEE